MKQDQYSIQSIQLCAIVGTLAVACGLFFLRFEVSVRASGVVLPTAEQIAVSTPDNDPMAAMQHPSRHVRVYVPAHDAGQLHPGMSAVIQSGLQEAHRGEKTQGTILQIAPASTNQHGREVLFEVELECTDSSFPFIAEFPVEARFSLGHLSLINRFFKAQPKAT